MSTTPLKLITNKIKEAIQNPLYLLRVWNTCVGT